MAQRTPRASTRHSPQALNTLVHIPDARHLPTGHHQDTTQGLGLSEKDGLSSEVSMGEESFTGHEGEPSKNGQGKEGQKDVLDGSQEAQEVGEAVLDD